MIKTTVCVRGGILRLVNVYHLLLASDRALSLEHLLLLHRFLGRPRSELRLAVILLRVILVLVFLMINHLELVWLDGGAYGNLAISDNYLVRCRCAVGLQMVGNLVRRCRKYRAVVIF